MSSFRERFGGLTVAQALELNESSGVDIKLKKED